MSREYPCVHWEDGKCKAFSDERVTSWCVESPCDAQRMSNADRIRAMSDEELAQHLATRSVNESTVLLLDEHNSLTAIEIEAIARRVYHNLLWWLKQPAEEDTE